MEITAQSRLRPGSRRPQKEGYPRGGWQFTFCSLLARRLTRIYLFLIALATHRSVENLRFPQLFHLLSPMESTRTVEISRQNGRFLPQNRPFLQENRAIFSRFHVRVPHISRRFLPGDVGNLELSGPQQIPPRPKGICPTFGQKSPAGGPAKWLFPPPRIPSDRFSSLGQKKKPSSSF